MATNTITHDHRGNAYELYEPLSEPRGEAWLPIICQHPDGCQEQAVRLNCTAEGNTNRTHWHGAIHYLDRERGIIHSLRHLCRAHGEVVKRT